jgi:hypothetical protein
MYVNGLRVFGYKYKIKPLDFVRVIFIDNKKAVNNNKKFIANILINKSIKKYLKTIIEYKMRPAFGTNVLLHIVSLRRKYNFFNLFSKGVLIECLYTFIENNIYKSIVRLYKNLKFKYLTIFSIYLRYYINSLLAIYIKEKLTVQHMQDVKLYFIQILIPFYRRLIFDFFNKKGVYYKKGFLTQNSILVCQVHKILVEVWQRVNDVSYKVNILTLQKNKHICTLYKKIFFYIFLLFRKG